MTGFNRRHSIQTCREHHAVLTGLLERFEDVRTVEPARVLQNIARLKTVLLRHLQLEDDWLYPALEGSQHPEVSAMARRYREEMGGLRGAFVAFLERWNTAEAIAADEDAFGEAWQGLRAALERRIAAEDDDLYDVAERKLAL